MVCIVWVGVTAPNRYALMPGNTASIADFVLGCLIFATGTGFLLGVPVLTIMALVHLFNRRWRTASATALGLVILCGYTFGIPRRSVDRIRFELTRSSYVTSLATATEPTGSRLKAWLFRDESVWVFTDMLYVVFDETDEISKPDAQWSDAWKKRADDAGPLAPGFEYLGSRVDHISPFSKLVVTEMERHWYFVDVVF